MNKLSIILANPHTTYAAVAYVLAKGLALMGAIWVPSHAQQFKDTAEVIEGAAVGWGLLNAGDAAQSVQKTAPAAPAP